ncbi:hypothetical protein F2P81_013208 [Scophthalmus maximus]|uniref:SPIN-DOC-like zinc-finger domain-containing protein n=1 Tax=Scophthalmus maximus TaxID=52904 RepID=A0A6A4SU87_SCOMX|nr:hypothetical protein F2P81_013208 [Scophthalmus maximus]
MSAVRFQRFVGSRSSQELSVSLLRGVASAPLRWFLTDAVVSSSDDKIPFFNISSAAYFALVKVDTENRQFNNEWTEKYVFIAVDANPVCLICNECLAVCKEYNLRRHFKTTHTNFDVTFPPGSAAWRQKIIGLTSCYEQRRRILFRACTDQERATAALLRVAWILGKKKKPFTDSETVKECMLASLEEVVTNEKTRKIIIDSVKKIPISDTSNMRRVESMASDVFKTLLDKLRKVMSLAVDESTDNSDVAQLCLYVIF